MSTGANGKNARNETVMNRSNIKTEAVQLGENDATPVRDEQYVSCPSPRQDNVGHNLSAAGWESDTEDNATIPVQSFEQLNPAETTSTNAVINSIQITKSETSNDNCPTPFRSNDNSNSPATDPGETILYAAVKKSEQVEFDNLPSDYFDSLIEGSFNCFPNSISKKETVDQLNLCSFEEGTKDLPKDRFELLHRDTIEIENISQQADDESKLAAQIELRRFELAKLEEETVSKKQKKHRKRKRHRTSGDKDNEHKVHERSRSISRDRRNNKKTDRKRIRMERSPAMDSRDNDATQYTNSSTYPPTDLPGASRVSVKVENARNKLDFVPVRQSERTIKTVNLNKLMAPPAPLPAAPLTVQNKRKLAVERVTALLNLMRLKSSKAPDSQFLVVDTIRRLPSSTSFMNRGIFENPSPICNNYNVYYRFNSIAGTRLNLAKWGLEALPAVTAQLLRLTGMDVERLMQVQLNTKMSHRMVKLKEEADAKVKTTEIDDYGTSLYANACTQTDSRLGSRSIGVQVLLELNSHRSNGAFWQDPNFSETNLSQQQANVMYALRELCTTVPGSSWADALFKALSPALTIKRSVERRSFNFLSNE